jgi:glycosyltransferase involved in cell wall biosynthesis
LARNSVLIVTLPPGLGGIAAQNRMAARLLRRHGHDVHLAWRASYRQFPDLSVPAWRAGRGRPRALCTTLDDMPALQVGTWLPEFEWAHHQPWRPWREVLARHPRHVVISGNVLPAWGLHRLGLPSLNWIASPYGPDRVDRIRRWPLARRLFDRALVGPVSARQEKELLRSTDVWAIGHYTLNGLRAIGPDNRVRGIIVIPVDVDTFHPVGRTEPAGRPLRICLSGRISDPRKGIDLLLQAFARVAAKSADVELHLHGDMTPQAFAARYGSAGLGERLHVKPAAPRADYPALLRRADIFVVSSYQEGLSQTAAEAMASGCCVVSTRCGGPEEFVIDGQTGLLADLDATSLADKLLQAIDDAALRRRLAGNGVALIRQRYTPARFEEQFMAAFATVYPTA